MPLHKMRLISMFQRKEKNGVDIPSTPSLRLKKLLISLVLLVCIGLFYAFVLIPMGISIPCPIRMRTGFLCPGCGVTRVCLGILQLQFSWAYAANPFLIWISPFLLYLCVKSSFLYVKEGTAVFGKFDNRLSLLIFILSVIWTIYRNFPL